MRPILVALLLFVALASVAADAPNPLLGSWKLTSWIVEFVDTGERRAVYGEHPKGHLILLPSGRMMAVLTGEGRKPPQGEIELADAFRSMAAYTGTYRLEGNKWTTMVDAAWHEGFAKTEQIRFYKIEGDTLSVESSPAPNVNNGNRMTKNILIWQRD